MRLRFLLLLLLATLPAVGLALYDGLNQRENVTATLQAEAVRAARMTAADEQRLFDSTRELLMALVQLPETTAGDTASCVELVQGLVRQTSSYTILAVADPKGDVWCSSTPPRARVNTADEPWFQAVLQSRNFALSDYMLGTISGKPVLVMGYPLVGDNRTVQSVVFAGLDLGQVSHIASLADLPPDSSVTLLDDQATILAGEPGSANPVGRSIRQTPLGAAIRASADGAGTVEAAGLDGVPRLYAYSPLHNGRGLAGYVVAGIPRAAADEAAAALMSRYLATIGLGAGLALLAALLAADRIVLRHIYTLVFATQRLRAGDLTARSRLPANLGELTELGGSFDQMAAALEERQGELSRAEATYRGLYRIAELSDSADDPCEVYAALHEVIAGLMYARNFFVALYDSATEMISYPYYVDEVDPPPEPMEIGNGLTARVIHLGQPVVKARADYDELVLRGELDPLGSPAVSWLGVPLQRGDKTFGALVVQSYDEAVQFGAEERDLLAFVSQQIASVLERKQVQAAEREQRQISEALRETASALTSTLSYDEVLERILNEVGRVVPHDTANIMIIEAGVARLVRGSGYERHGVYDIIGMELALAGVPTLQQIVDTGLPLAIPDVTAEPRWMRPPKIGWIRSNACAPIRVKGEVIGFLNVDSEQPGFFDSSSAERLQAFADQAGVAIENAQLYHEIRGYAALLEQRVAERTAELSAREQSLRSTMQALSDTAARLQEANSRLTELDRMKSEFVSNVSHELRTPLANIKLYLSLLERGKPDKRDVYLATLKRESDLLHQLIEQVLDLSRLDLQGHELAVQPVDVNALVATLVQDRKELVGTRGLVLTAETQPGMRPALGERKLLTQVLTNLMTNAMNYTPAGGAVVVRTAEQTREDGHWVTVSVVDNGPGISAGDLPHLFERFYRGQSARQSATPGTGLGLPISREIVARLGGVIDVQSQPGAGSTFTVWLRPAVNGFGSG